ncbi:hypothetical protein AB0I28_12500 [Phytomonospora sp. NPDC050363]|uniref:hypothetical protein n=1 Tax=Phytomonospora sp. NPDC050363 TaxID=3155642 RepID=UPI0033D4C77F
MTAANRYEMSGSYKGVSYSIVLDSNLPDDECDPADDLGGKVLQAVKRAVDAQVKAMEPVPLVADTHYSVGLPACGIRECTWHTTDVSRVTCPICLESLSPARERGTYVGNTTSREQEGQ